ncbi:acyl-CoA N-acyltransferase [Apodospora peruviana]|uniref:Acyl-CoA N-acyltransferase n=1 Tax=Apodospora peruviana TaxID=516989 RepID=A0AAE0IB90_9PEZI|nr:acyl-CoA N-acyltransferase [Apodospora peruviana]
MPLRIRPASESDAVAMARIGGDAFRHSLNTALFPARLAHLEATVVKREDGLDGETAWRVGRTLNRMRDPGIITLVATNDENESEVLGYAHWEVPYDNRTKKDVAEKISLYEPPTLDKEATAQLGKALDEETEQLFGKEGHKNMYYLLVLAVDPKHQGRGIGKMLLHWGLKKATIENKPVYLHASPDGKPLYLSQGFRDLGEFDVCGFPHTSMLFAPTAWTIDPVHE